MKPIYDNSGREIRLCVGVCCREWIMAYGYPHSACGFCGERPIFDRWYEDEEVGEGGASA